MLYLFNHGIYRYAETDKVVNFTHFVHSSSIEKLTIVNSEPIPSVNKDDFSRECVSW
jgi:hypothetical protein